MCAAKARLNLQDVQQIANELRCVICYDFFEEPRVTACNHCFCKVSPPLACFPQKAGLATGSRSPVGGRVADQARALGSGSPTDEGPGVKDAATGQAGDAVWSVLTLGWFCTHFFD